jgi:phosphoribosylformimino-5-aminoimidazole carboxamide ribotide isomerase
MIVAPALDLQDGRCVQLVGGAPGTERISSPDPARVARYWWEMGFETLHVVDLDAALNRGHNRDQIRRVVRATEAFIQVGGGLPDEEAIDEILSLGVNRVILGTRALEDLDWLEKMAETEPWRVIVAADAMDGKVLQKGWQESSGISVDEFVGRLKGLPLAGVLMTDIAREGRLAGINPALVDRTISSTEHPVWISGGVSDDLDLRAAEGCGAHGVVIGMELYTNRMDAAKVAKEYGR